jgi:hypothetical protein
MRDIYGNARFDSTLTIIGNEIGFIRWNNLKLQKKIRRIHDMEAMKS